VKPRERLVGCSFWILLSAAAISSVEAQLQLSTVSGRVLDSEEAPVRQGA